MIGAIVTIGASILSLVAPKVLTALSLTDPLTIASAGATIFQVVSLAAGIFTAYARKKSPIQPITLSQAAADVHPATLAAVRELAK